VLEPPAHLGDVVAVPGTMPISHRYTAGLAGERFFRALAGRGAFLATRCPACAVVYCPARAFCERCLAALDDECDVGPAGRVVTLTVVRVGLDGARLAEPVPVGVIRLDGADTCLVHRLTPAAAALGPGAAVEPLLRPPGERTGCLDDVIAFRSVPEAARPTP
jgi:uncharacterized OB-fold protein